jgi:Galactose oxidase, central domain
MSWPRDSHTATPLNDGRVVVIGGYVGEGAGVLASIEIIDPTSAATSVEAPLEQARGGHAAAATTNGDVLVVGGRIGPRTYTASTELFDHEQGQTRSVADAPHAADALDASPCATDES